MTVCPTCGEDKSSLGRHWAASCSYPEIENEKIELIEGLLYGDGHITNPSHNSRFEINMINGSFINNLESELGWLCSSTQKIEKDGNNVFRLQTVSHPKFNELRDEWYEDGKVLPLDDLTPKKIKMWYVSDGSLKQGKYPLITNWANDDQKDEIVSKLNNIGMDVTPQIEGGGQGYAYVLTNREHFFNYLGSAPDGFKYKWP